MATVDALSNLRVEGFNMVPVIQTKVSRSRGATVEAETTSFYHWQAEITCSFADAEEDAEIMHYVHRCRPANDHMLLYDVNRPRPLTEGDTPMSVADAEGTISSIAHSKSISVQGHKANLVLKRGDYVEFRVTATDQRQLTLLRSNVTLDGTGAGTLSLVYPVNTQVFIAGSVSNFEKPSCRTHTFGIPRRLTTASNGLQGTALQFFCSGNV